MRPARTAAALALAGCLTGWLTGCSVQFGSVDGLPTCATGSAPLGNGVVLLAQSVPTATWVPCLRESALPRGWAVVEMEAARGGAHLRLASDRAGDQAVRLELAAACDTAGATEVPTDHPGLRRFERVTEVSPDFRGQRSYVFPGGCITLALRVEGRDRVEPLAVLATAVDVVRRTQVQALVRERTGGRLALDPGDGVR